MARDLYVRVKPKSPVTTFGRCGFQFSLLWVLLEALDDATYQRLNEEQMLETSVEKPEYFDQQEALAAAEAEATSVQPDPITGLVGSSVLTVDITYESGFTIAQVDLVQAVFEATGLSATGFNALPQDTRDLLLQVYADRLNAEHVALAAANNAVTDLTNKLNAANSSLSSVTSERDGLNTRVSTLSTQVSTLTSDKGALETQVTTLTNKVTGLEAELATAKAAAEKAATKNKTKPAE